MMTFTYAPVYLILTSFKAEFRLLITAKRHLSVRDQAQKSKTSRWTFTRIKSNSHLWAKPNATSSLITKSSSLSQTLSTSALQASLWPRKSKISSRQLITGRTRSLAQLRILTELGTRCRYPVSLKLSWAPSLARNGTLWVALRPLMGLVTWTKTVYRFRTCSPAGRE